MQRNRSLPRAAALGMAAAAVALLTSCTQNGSTAASSPPPSGTPTSSPPPSGTLPNSPPTSSPPPSGTAAGSPPTSSLPNAAHTTAGSPPKPAAGCRSLLVSPTVKADVTAAYGKQAQPPLTHIAPVKGTFYYGTCDGTLYAGTRFQLTPGATSTEQVALQDEGTVMKYFKQTPDTGWRYMASDEFPASPQGCAAIPQIPASLAALWNGCRSTG